ncbi:hypothetical protein KVT40_007624 [Elsinoe batatas]|uniref:Uncharacterized protein n=1 Tax=Elsinoe batatas TaxID=2601811 RepID=A0A8K0PDG2_9PEZI|nr:hypothetical protein KVT40_007624 [Elsinoe batatas]
MIFRSTFLALLIAAFVLSMPLKNPLHLQTTGLTEPGPPPQEIKPSSTSGSANTATSGIIPIHLDTKKPASPTSADIPIQLDMKSTPPSPSSANIPIQLDAKLPMGPTIPPKKNEHDSPGSPCSQSSTSSSCYTASPSPQDSPSSTKAEPGTPTSPSSQSVP